MPNPLSNLINAIADRIRPCKHEFELVLNEKITKKDYSGIIDKYNRKVYMCKHCGLQKVISSK